MKARCIRPSFSALKHGIVYEVRPRDSDDYYDVLINGEWRGGWYRSRFEIVADKPAFKFKIEATYSGVKPQTYLLESEDPAKFADFLRDNIETIAKHGGQIELRGISPSSIIQVDR